MSWFIGILTFFLVIDCLLLILLVLVQLPKKEAGIGQAFGGAATDALFGSGSGNALTKMTKYATIVFFLLTMGVSMLYGIHNRRRGGDFRQFLTEADKAQPLPGQVAKTTPTNAAAAAAAAAAAIKAAAPTGAVEKAVTTAAPPATATPPAVPAPAK